MTDETRVHIRRVDGLASPPVMVAARLSVELGAGHQVQLIGAAEPVLLRVTGSDHDLPARVAAVLAEARFRGWELVDPPNGRCSA